MTFATGTHSFQKAFHIEAASLNVSLAAHIYKAQSALSLHAAHCVETMRVDGFFSCI